MSEDPTVPTPESLEDDDPTFDAPWQARAFGLAVALRDRGDGYDWEEFQSRLIEEVEATAGEREDSEAVYYEQWLRALERLLVEKGLVSAAEVEERAREFAATDRTAEEFVEGRREH